MIVVIAVTAQRTNIKQMIESKKEAIEKTTSLAGIFVFFVFGIARTFYITRWENDWVIM